MRNDDARLLGAGLIIAVESKPDRAALAKKLGADVVIDPLQGDVAEQIHQLRTVKASLGH